MEDRLTFWKKLKISITDFEKYQDLAAEKVGKTIMYIVVIMVIFSIVTTGLYTYKFTTIIENIKQYIADNIETITFENNKLSVVPNNKEEEVILIEESKNLSAKIIINTNIEDEEMKSEKIEEIKSSGNGILILNDRIFIKNELLATPHEWQYKELAKQFNITDLNKQKVIDSLSNESIMPIIIVGTIIIFIDMLIVYLSSVLIDILIFSAMGYIFTIISRVRIKYSAVYNIAAYSVTLPVILNLMYFVANFFTGFTIKYFEIMYTAIASIYIITAILMIKSDVIKKQMELARIIEEQEKIKEELKKREEEQKQEEERERERKEEERKRKQEENDNEESSNKEKKKNKKQKKEGTDINIGKEPEGNNV